MKRLIDIISSVCGLILFLPAFILIPVLIKFDDGGPVFFLQARLGQFKRPFQMYIRALLFKLVWRFVTYSAAIAVSIDHYRALKAMQIPMRLVWQRWMYLVHATEHQVVAANPDYQFLRQVNTYYSIKSYES